MLIVQEDGLELSKAFEDFGTLKNEAIDFFATKEVVKIENNFISLVNLFINHKKCQILKISIIDFKSYNIKS